MQRLAAMKLTDIALTAAGSDRYTGTAKNAEGVPYKITVRYRPGEIRIDTKVGAHNLVLQQLA